MQCKLCEKQSKLCKSHIIPEFFYKPFYKDGRRILLIPSNEAEKVRLYQKGLRENLLCEDCEALISPLETYAKKLFFGGRLNIEEVERSKHHFISKGIDYKKFKLFQMSILWRAGVADGPMFQFVSLGQHEERLRKMLLDRDPGEPHTYGCAISAILPLGGASDLIRSPQFIRVDGHICYRFMFGGFLWIFSVSKHSKTFPLKDLFLTEDGRLCILTSHLEDLEFMKYDADLMSKRQGAVLSFIGK